MSDFILHLGYPKTGTTTLQTHFFPAHPQIDYLGKFIPSHRFSDERVFDWVDSLATASEHAWDGGGDLAEFIARARRQTACPVLLLSSEVFLHPTTIELELVARRLKRLFPDARIMIGLRDQFSLLRSFHYGHGEFGQYLFSVRTTEEGPCGQLSFDDWMTQQLRTPYKNVLGTLFYDRVLDAYSDLFGSENLYVYLYEEWADCMIDVLTSFARFAGVDAARVDASIQARAENVRGSMSRPATLPVNDTPDDVLHRWRSLTASMFGPGNCRLEERYGLRVRAYQYSGTTTC